MLWPASAFIIPAQKTALKFNNKTHWIPGTSTNKITKWEESNPGSLLSTVKRTYIIKFKKAYSGSGQIELTGDWRTSASLNGIEAGRVSVPKIYYQP